MCVFVYLSVYMCVIVRMNPWLITLIMCLLYTQYVYLSLSLSVSVCLCLSLSLSLSLSPSLSLSLSVSVSLSLFVFLTFFIEHLRTTASDYC